MCCTRTYANDQLLYKVYFYAIKHADYMNYHKVFLIRADHIRADVTLQKEDSLLKQ